MRVRAYILSGKVYDEQSGELLKVSDGWTDPLVERLISLTNFCRAFHQLPRAGGVLDQDALNMIGMHLVIEAQQHKEELDHNKAQANQQAKSRQKGK